MNTDDAFLNVTHDQHSVIVFPVSDTDMRKTTTQTGLVNDPTKNHSRSLLQSSLTPMVLSSLPHVCYEVTLLTKLKLNGLFCTTVFIYTVLVNEERGLVDKL